MKKLLVTLSLAATTALTGTSAFANTGTINFEGKITSSTCPIEVVNPGDGSVGNLVKMGSIEAGRFTAIGQEYSGKAFVLRVKGGAGCTGSTASVQFNGATDASGDYFAVTPTQDGAKGVVINIKDRKGTALKPGADSPDYDLNATGSTDLLFNAYYRSTAAAVTAGVASADVQFIVAIN